MFKTYYFIFLTSVIAQYMKLKSQNTNNSAFNRYSKCKLQQEIHSKRYTRSKKVQKFEGWVQQLTAKSTGYGMSMTKNNRMKGKKKAD
jgi:hypothetical protein